MELKDRHITFLGDSITYGVGASAEPMRYSTVLCRMAGAVEYNMGISGTTLCTDGERHSRFGDVDAIPQDTDILVIFLGTNDFDACHADEGEISYALGTRGSSDTSTIYGAADAYCRKIKSIFKEKCPFVCFVTPAVSGWNRSVDPEARDNFDPNKRNACGYTVPELSEALSSVAASYGFTSFLLHESVTLLPSDFKDGLHPNDGGMRKIAEGLYAFLKNI